MLLYIDPREGSSRFLKEFPGQSEELMLDGGDIAFFGNGPVGDWYIGIEHKQVNDLVDCIKTGRFSGTQLPEMAKLYDICFLLIEGACQPDYAAPVGDNDFRLWRPFGGGRGMYFGITYKQFDNFQTSVATFSALYGKPCIIKHARDKKESVQIIRDLYAFFQKPWSEHKSMFRPDGTKVQRINTEIELIRIEPEDVAYPEYVLRKSLFQIKGISWDTAGIISTKFGTMEVALAAGQKDWEAFDCIGKVLAKRAYECLHGYSDPNVKKRKKAVE